GSARRVVDLVLADGATEREGERARRQIDDIARDGSLGRLLREDRQAAVTPEQECPLVRREVAGKDARIEPVDVHARQALNGRRLTDARLGAQVGNRNRIAPGIVLEVLAVRAAVLTVNVVLPALQEARELTARSKDAAVVIDVGSAVRIPEDQRQQQEVAAPLGIERVACS